MPKQKVLITGGTGLVGGTLLLSDELFDQFMVYATFRENRLETSQTVEWIQVDLANQFAKITTILSDLKPDAIIHCAAESHVDRCAQDYQSCAFINSDVSAELAKNAYKLGCHFVHLSSDFVFSGEEAPYSENSQRNPVNSYGRTKLNAEDAILKACPSASIVRTVLVYGYVPTLSRGNILTWVVNSLKQGKAIRVIDDQFRKPTSVKELAKALITLAVKGHRGVFHICGSEVVSVYEMALIIAETFELDSSLIARISSEQLNQENLRPKNTVLEINKAQYVLNYHPKPITQSLLEYQPYFRT